MLGWRRKPAFDPDTLSSIWVMACRDDSPVLTAFSVAYRLGGTTPDAVMELVRGRREMFRIGLTRGQSRGWKGGYRPPEPGTGPSAEGGKDGEPAPEPKPVLLPDWLLVFDEEGPKEDQDRVREWLKDPSISSSNEALERFLDDGFVVDDIAFRSQFRADHALKAEPSDLATVNWGLEHIERLRRGRAETRQSIVALTTGIGGVAIGAMVALTAPMVTTIYQGRPVDTARLTIDHQTRLTGYGTLGTAVAKAQRAARVGDGEALAGALTDLQTAITTLSPLLDPATRQSLRDEEARVLGTCGGPGPTCVDAVAGLERLLDGTLAEVTVR